MYLYTRDLSEPKYEYLIKKIEDLGIKHLNIQMHLLSVRILWMMFMRILRLQFKQKKNILLVFDYIIADIMTNKKFQTIIKELCKKQNIILVFITQPYFSVPEDVRLNST